MELRFWGTRGSIPSPGPETVRYGGNTTCVELILDDGTLIIFDAGTGIRGLGDSLIKQKRNGVIHLFLTHSHWDHIQGFPFFAPAYSRETELKIFGCPPTYNKLREILTNQMESKFFPVNFEQLNAKISFQEICNGEHPIGDARFSFIRNNHPGVAYGFRIEENGKSIVFITDNELKPPRNANTPWREFVAFSRHTDLLVHDAHYLQAEMSETAGYGHSSYEQAFSLGIEAEPKRLIFFHHRPERSDNEIDLIIDRFKQQLAAMHIDMKLDAATEGLRYKI